MIKRVLFGLLLGLSLQTGSQAGFVEDFFKQNGALSNTTHAGIREAGALNAYTGGGYVYKTPRNEFHAFQVTPPSLTAGCGGIDIFLGAFAIPSREEFVSFLRSVGTALPGLAFQLALQTMAPDLNEMVGRYADLIRSYTNRYSDSCEAAKALLEQTGAAEQMSRVLLNAKNALRASGTVSDQSEADRRVRDNGGAAIAAAPTRRDASGNVIDAAELNLTWAMLSGGRFNDAAFNSKDLKETMMTLIGTTVFRESGSGANQVIETEEFAPVDLLPVLFGETGEGGAVLKLTCDEETRCLAPTRTVMKDFNLFESLKTAAANYRLAIKKRDASLVTDAELLQLSGITSVPLLRVLNLASLTRYEGIADDLVNTYVEVAAYEALVTTVEALAGDIRVALGSTRSGKLSSVHSQHAMKLLDRVSDVERRLYERRDRIMQAMIRASSVIESLEHVEKALRTGSDVRGGIHD